MSFSSLFDHLRPNFDFARLRARIARYDAPVAFPDYEWNANRFLLCRRDLYSRQRWRYCATAHERSWLQLVPAFLAGRKSDLLYFEIRRQIRSLYDACRWRGAVTAYDFGHARPARHLRPHGA